MKRNRITLLWLLVVLIVMLIMWIVPAQFNPVQVQSQEDATSEAGSPWENIDFMLSDESINNDYVRIKYQDGQFNYLLSDVNHTDLITAQIYDEVYSLFPLTNRPNLREYQLVSNNDSEQFWYMSPYLRNREKKLTFDYTIIDKENSKYTEFSHRFEEEDYYNYTYLSYAEDNQQYYILLELYNENYTQANLHHLTIDKETAEVVRDERVEYDGDSLYELSTQQQMSQPSKHMLGVGGGDRMSESYSPTASNNSLIAILDPTTLEFIEIELPIPEEANQSGLGSNLSLALFKGENLHYISIQNNSSTEGESPSQQITMYQYDWERAEFEESWTKELTKVTSYTIDSSQLYLSTVEDTKLTRIARLSIDSGEIEMAKDFIIQADSDYEFVSSEFGRYY